MRTTLLILFIATGLISSCHKPKNIQTRVGFYILKPNYQQTNDGSEYDLYIDQQYRGKLQVSLAETTDSTLLNFQTLDTKKHIIEVQINNTKVSSTYLQISDCKTASGSAQQIADGYPNGAILKNLYKESYATYAIMQ